MRVPSTTKQIDPIKLLKRRRISYPLKELPLGDKVDVLVVGEKVVNNSQKAPSMMLVVEPRRVVVKAKGGSVAGIKNIRNFR